MKVKIVERTLNRSNDNFDFMIETLSIIISKAMLLANDVEIKDPTILSQLN